jgi:hypothetical protein
VGFAAPVGLAFAAFVEALAWLITAALLVVWDQTIGAAFRYIAGLMTFTVNTHLHYKKTFDLGRPFRVADNAIKTWLIAERDGLSIELGWTLHALSESWHATASAVEWLTHETADTLEWIEGVKLPRWAKWAATAALPAALLTKLIAAAVAHLRPGLIREVKVIEHAIPAKAITIVRQAATHTLPVPLGIPRLRHKVDGLEHDLADLRKALRHPATLIGAAAGAAIIANALGGLSARCIRRGNIGKAARRICGMDGGLFESLLADGLVIVGAISVVEFAEGLLAIEKEAVAILGAGIREFPG